MKIVVLHDDVAGSAHPDERDGLLQARSVAEALASRGHRCALEPFTLDFGALQRRLLRHAPDVVFNGVEAPRGHGRWIHLVPSLLEGMGLAYTGASAEALFLTSQKLLAKRLLAASGLPTPPAVTADTLRDHAPVPAARCIVKAVWEDASLGIEDASVVEAPDAEALRRGLEARTAAVGGDAFAEAYVDGREFNLALLAKERDAELLPPAEIRFADWPADKPRIVGYAAKWQASSFEYAHTVRRFDFPAADRDLLGRLGALAVACWRALGLSGYARVDFRVDASGRPWILEVNANPSLSPDAGFLAAADRAHLDLPAVAERVVAAALVPPPRVA